MPRKEYKPSQYIADFLNFLKDSQSLYNYAVDMEDKEEKLTQDFLHKLEFEANDYKTKCKVVKQENYHTDRTYYPRILKQWEFYEKGE